MTRDEFDQALLRFGADLERWPSDRAAAARRLVAEDASAAKMLADFAAIERAVAAAVRSPPFGAAEIGSVLAALDATEETWRPTWRFWIAGASASVLSFAAGGMVVLATLSADGDLDAALSIIGLATGMGDIGGLL